MSGDRLNVDTDLYVRAAGENGAPPAISSDPLVAGLTPIEQLLRVLGLAANADDPQDNADSIQAQADRDIQTIADAEAFAAHDQQAAQMAQQIPQLISGIAGAVAGALGGALQPLTQIPQQVAQVAAQTGTVLSQTAGSADLPVDDLTMSDLSPIDDLGADLGAFGDTNPDGGADGGSGGAGGFGGTTPTALLGPPPVPSASTAPAAAPAIPMSPPSTPATTPSPAGGMAGVPMVPPGAMQGGATGDKDTKTDTKRVSVPPVRNGSPVQGRLSVHPVAPAVITTVDGKPVATKRIIGLDTGEAETAGPR